MKNLMMETVYGEIDKATTWKHLQKVEGMLEMFFLMINTNDITYRDYQELCSARDRRSKRIASGEFVKHL